jgi:hypothetical protein
MYSQQAQQAPTFDIPQHGFQSLVDPADHGFGAVCVQLSHIELACPSSGGIPIPIPI